MRKSGLVHGRRTPPAIRADTVTKDLALGSPIAGHHPPCRHYERILKVKEAHVVPLAEVWGPLYTLHHSFSVSRESKMGPVALADAENVKAV